MVKDWEGLGGLDDEWYEYYVFWCRHSEPTHDERQDGVFLKGEAESEYLDPFFRPLYEHFRVGIVPSDDSVLTGPALAVLGKAIEEATCDVNGRPKKWPVDLGFTMGPDGRRDAPLIEYAHRSRLLPFLEKVAEIIRKAQDANGFVYFGGGR